MCMITHLHAKGRVGTTDAIDLATANGHLNVVTFLETKGYVCTTRAIEKAVVNGHTDVVAFLYAKWPEITATVVGPLESAAANGRLRILQFLDANGMMGRTTSAEAIQLASATDHKVCVEWLQAVRDETMSDSKVGDINDLEGHRDDLAQSLDVDKRVESFQAFWRTCPKAIDFIHPERHPIFAKLDGLITLFRDNNLLLSLAADENSFSLMRSTMATAITLPLYCNTIRSVTTCRSNIRSARHV
ncbi:Aste57867_16590 [Aphanomyces stellatus]|uniref:Aste57867_16590 protein n=1 Tax=Aphanomyces stellatus TaxID=120398 RepID=A0A485L659_9STRA|nr:hypothetical protein As57867_016533 [Aphanomyces stellatus]VFT93361.1 Aste57867_16590 [Aphanomyces stellatus]